MSFDKSQINFVIDVNNLLDLDVEHALVYIRAFDKKVLSDISIFDLCSFNGVPFATGHGIYLFFSPSSSSPETWYIGKAQAMSFVERIPKHFDPREDAWFATLLQRSLKYGLAKDSHEGLKILAQSQLLLIHFPKEFVSCAGQFDNLLRAAMKPKLNSKNMPVNMNQTIRDYLGE